MRARAANPMHLIFEAEEVSGTLFDDVPEPEFELEDCVVEDERVYPLLTLMKEGTDICSTWGWSATGGAVRSRQHQELPRS